MSAEKSLRIGTRSRTHRRGLPDGILSACTNLLLRGILILKKKIVIGCYEVPAYGGAATSAYQLFERLKNDGIEASYINIINHNLVEYFRQNFGENYGNPKSLPGVFNCVLQKPWVESHPEISDRIAELNPDLMIGVGFIAGSVLKQASPERPLTLLTCSLNQTAHALKEQKISDYLTFEKERSRFQPQVYFAPERDAFDLADKIVVHSDMTLSLMNCFFPGHMKKVHSNVIWFAEWIYDEALRYSRLAKNFPQRDIDVLFIASSWNRPVKNFPFVQEIIPQLKDLHVHLVGFLEQSTGAIEHGLIVEREKLFELIGRAKCIVCPSLFDAAPGILFEASALNSNIVASRNCGNWMLCNKQLLVEDFTAKEFVKKIRLAVTQKYEDHMNFFLEQRSYHRLKEMLAVA